MINRSKDWWLSRIENEPDVPIRAGAPCEHQEFAADVGVHRLTNNEGVVTGYMAEIRVHCSACKRQFQFLGLEPGIDLQGARVSIDGLEANIAICPQGEQPSALDRIAVNFPPIGRH